MQPLTLTPTNRLQLARAFRRHIRVDMSIDCVVEGQMGRAFADDAAQPRAFLILLGDFFAYLAGDPHSPAARNLAAALTGAKMIMPRTVADPDDWAALLQELHGDKLVPITRYRYTSDSIDPTHLHNLLRDSPHDAAIRRIDLPLAQQFGAHPQGWMDIGDFDSPQDFLNRSIGYCLTDGDTLTGVAYGSLVCSRGIEVSIFVHPDYRRLGIATALAAALLSYCLQNNMDANWDAANRESCALAERLGYTALGPYTAHFLRA